MKKKGNKGSRKDNLSPVGNESKNFALRLRCTTECAAASAINSTANLCIHVY